MVAGPVSTAATGLLFARGRAGVSLLAVVLHTVAWFLVALPLLPILGAEAMGCGWLAACLIDLTVQVVALRREEVRVLRPTIASVALAFGGGAIAWAIASGAASPGVGLVLALLAGEAVYVAGMLMLRRDVLVDLLGILRRASSGHRAPSGHRDVAPRPA
jgi:hypothetical protein